METENLMGSRGQSARSNARRRKNRYIDVNDLRALLRIALGLHAAGDPHKRLTRAFDGLSHLAGADAWAATVLPSKASGAPPLPRLLSGGKDAKTARRLAAQIVADIRAPKTPIGRLFRGAHIPGRVLAALDGGWTIHSILRPDSGDGRPPVQTWISIARGAADPVFLERERRIVELFHSQSSWLLADASIDWNEIVPLSIHG